MTAARVVALGRRFIRTVDSDGTTREWDANTLAYIKTLPAPNTGDASQAEESTL